jgi:hypothetical protein
MTTDDPRCKVLWASVLAVTAVIILSAGEGAAADDDLARRWERLVVQQNDGVVPGREKLIELFPIDNPEFSSFMMERLDCGLGVDDGRIAGLIVEAHGVDGMALIESAFAERAPAGKVLLMKAMQQARMSYIESYRLLVEAMEDEESVEWNPPKGRKGGEPLPPGNVRLRVRDHAFNSFCGRLHDWKPLVEAIGARRSIDPTMEIVERDKMIASMKKVWQLHAGNLKLPSYKETRPPQDNDQ